MKLTDDQKEEIVGTAAGLLGLLGLATWLTLIVLSFTGCSSVLESTLANDAILNTRLSGIGVIMDSAAAAPGTPKGIIGVGEISYTLSPTAEGEIRSPAIINRTAVLGPFSVDAATTSAVGDVGDELQAAGEHGSKALEALHPREAP